ncbi:Calcineurin-like phosphoesterase [Noviherbaspirillum humi]|uniref:Calcineurin-like phosphoesterase n=1 Tax=Noviherbaspirillum humi TaxID=1688639 RepID=A0A239EXR2_9BURK|nr:metallophosphoesterase [Noviherbaspirillum humi]SNS49221.1 Calcineurin-like phosphoesterase [Noviherbaspirillum humi]
MRIQLVSDLHLENYPTYVPPAAPGVDILLLAGDIGSYQAGSKLQDDDFGLGRFSPRGPQAKWPRVFYLPGNHEFDALDFDATYARLRRTCDALGIEWLEREVITVGSVRFVGTTLWSDFESLAKDKKSEAERIKALEKACRAANFYLSKNTTLRNGKPMLAEDIRELAFDCQRWLNDALAIPFDGTTVSVTHFAPTLGSADPRYGVTPGTAGFCNALDHLLPRADMWIHGHLHCENDFVVSGVEAGKPFSCRVVANPRGYPEKGEDKAFRETFVIELP